MLLSGSKITGRRQSPCIAYPSVIICTVRSLVRSMLGRWAGCKKAHRFGHDGGQTSRANAHLSRNETYYNKTRLIPTCIVDPTGTGWRKSGKNWCLCNTCNICRHICTGFTRVGKIIIGSESGSLSHLRNITIGYYCCMQGA